MATAHDVAAYVLRDTKMSAMKLQKLVYYSQAWSLVWDGKPLFEDEIQAWAHGPVVRSLYAQHRGKYLVDRADFTTGDAGALKPDQAETIDIVLAAYGSMSAAQLSALTHAETPWKQARKDLGDGDFGSAEISHESMRAFYTQLSASGESVSDAADVNFPSWAS